MSAILLLNLDRELPLSYFCRKMQHSIYGSGNLQIRAVYDEMKDKLSFFSLQGNWYILGDEIYGSPFERSSLTKKNCPEMYQSQCAVSQWLYDLVFDLTKNSFRVSLMNIIHCSFVDFDPNKISYKKLNANDILKDDIFDLGYYVVNEIK